LTPAHNGGTLGAAMIRPVRLVLLIAFLMVPLVLQGGSLPHTHFGEPDGFFNHDHDLTLLATLATVASLDAVAPVVAMVLVVTAASVRSRRRPPAVVARAADSRAPPVR
jgi:hypothetical protein